MTSELLRSLSSSIDGISRTPGRMGGELGASPSVETPSRSLASELLAKETGELSMAEVIASKVDAVVRIQGSCLKFDWLMPYKHGDQSEMSGSGFFFSAEGLIVTNAHVVGELSRMWVSIPCRGEARYEAQLVGICFDSDLAVLVAPQAPVRCHLELGISADVRIGETVVALGYPLGMKSVKLTMGVVSGTAGALLQTDAALNPGNSGGPMLNARGEVVGINVALMIDSQNIGFSIPVVLFQILLKQLLDPSRMVVSLPVLGASLQNSTLSIMSFLGLRDEGILATQVAPGFPLHEAGIRDGDVIHSISGFQLDNFGTAIVPWSIAPVQIFDIILVMTAADAPELVYSRGNKRLTTTLKFEDQNNPGQVCSRIRSIRFFILSHAMLHSC